MTIFKIFFIFDSSVFESYTFDKEMSSGERKNYVFSFSSSFTVSIAFSEEHFKALQLGSPQKG